MTTEQLIKELEKELDELEIPDVLMFDLDEPDEAVWGFDECRKQVKEFLAYAIKRAVKERDREWALYVYNL